MKYYVANLHSIGLFTPCAADSHNLVAAQSLSKC